jgi:hypothetical protein
MCIDHYQVLPNCFFLGRRLESPAQSLFCMYCILTQRNFRTPTHTSCRARVLVFYLLLLPTAILVLETVLLIK